MSADNERRARELLAKEWRADGHDDMAILMSTPALATTRNPAIRAIVAALEEAPAGSVGGEAVLWRAPHGNVFMYFDEEPLHLPVREPLYTHPAPPVVDEAMVRRAMNGEFCGHRMDDALNCGTDYAYEVMEAALTAALSQPSQTVTFKGIPIVENPDMAPDEVRVFNRPSQPGEEVE